MLAFPKITFERGGFVSVAGSGCNSRQGHSLCESQNRDFWHASDFGRSCHGRPLASLQQDQQTVQGDPRAEWHETEKRPIFFIFFLSFLFFSFLFNLKFSLNRGNPQRGENWEPGPEQTEGLPGPASLPGFGRQICSLAAGIWVPRQCQLAKI